MTDPFRGFSVQQWDPSSGDPAAIAAGIAQLVENAERFQLKWRIIPATVLTPSSDYTKVRVDGDASASNAVSLIGRTSMNSRVMILSIPPSNKFIIGWIGIGGDAVNTAAMQHHRAGLNGTSTTGNDDTVSATFVNMAGTAAVTTFSFTKLYAANVTRLQARMKQSFVAVGGNVMAEIALRINGVDYVMGAEAPGAAGEYGYVSGERFITGVPAGTYTVQARWRRAAGGGANAARRDVNTWLSAMLEEIAL
jgi:hypothetical protein